MRPKLRDNQLASWPYKITAIPQSHIFAFAEEITQSAYLGKSDIQGDEWGDMFARAINGAYLASPVGHVDVTKGKLAWSVKTIKDKNPHKKRTIRIISGRNSPDYSFGIKNVHDDINKTGAAVLSIWNERVNLSINSYKIIPRLSILRPDPLLFFKPTHPAFQAHFRQAARSANHNSLWFTSPQTTSLIRSYFFSGFRYLSPIIRHVLTFRMACST